MRLRRYCVIVNAQRPKTRSFWTLRGAFRYRARLGYAYAHVYHWDISSWSGSRGHWVLVRRVLG